MSCVLLFTFTASPPGSHPPTATHTSTTKPLCPTPLSNLGSGRFETTPPERQHLYQITNDFRCFLKFFKFHYWPLERENASAILYHAVYKDRSGIRAKARPELFSGFFCVPATAWTLLPPTSTHLCSLFTHLPSYITCKPLWPAPLPYAPEPTHARSYRPTKCECVCEVRHTWAPDTLRTAARTPPAARDGILSVERDGGT